MYLNYKVKIPDSTSGISRKTIKGVTYMHMARPNGRFCGAKRPKCEAEQPLGFD